MTNDMKKPIPPFSLRLSVQEKARLQQAAAGKPLGTYIRGCLFGGSNPPRRARGRDYEILAKLLAALGKSELSAQLNELSLAVKSGSLPVTPDTEAQIQRVCAHVAHMRTMLMKALGMRKEK